MIVPGLMHSSIVSGFRSSQSASSWHVMSWHWPLTQESVHSWIVMSSKPEVQKLFDVPALLQVNTSNVRAEFSFKSQNKSETGPSSPQSKFSKHSIGRFVQNESSVPGKWQESSVQTSESSQSESEEQRIIGQSTKTSLVAKLFSGKSSSWIKDSIVML